VIGTGSSGIQSIPLIAAAGRAAVRPAAHTVKFAIPAWNGRMDPEVMRHTRENYADYRQKILDSFVAVPFETQDQGAHEADPQTRQAVFEAAWKDGGYLMLLAYPDLIFDERSNAHVSAFVKQKIQARIQRRIPRGENSRRAIRSAPSDCASDTDYFETYNRANVTLVSLRETPLQEIIPVASAPAVVTSTSTSSSSPPGFDAMTGALLAVDIRGRNGISLRTRGPRPEVTTSVSPYPGFRTCSPSRAGKPIRAVEHGPGDRAARRLGLGDLLTYMRNNGFETVEAERQPELDWAARVDEIASATLYPPRRFLVHGRNVPGKVEGFMPFAGGTIMYRGDRRGHRCPGVQRFRARLPARQRARSNTRRSDRTEALLRAGPLGLTATRGFAGAAPLDPVPPVVWQEAKSKGGKPFTSRMRST